MILHTVFRANKQIQSIHTCLTVKYDIIESDQKKRNFE